MKDVPHKSSIQNLDANLVAMLVYIIPLIISVFFSQLRMISWILIPVLVLIFEKKSYFVKYHAAQALTVAVFYTAIAILDAILGFFGFTISLAMQAPFVGFMVGGVLGLIMAAVALAMAILSIIITVLVIIIAIKAYNYESIHIPGMTSLAQYILRFHW